MKAFNNFIVVVFMAFLWTGCFAHREAPPREVSCDGMPETEAMAETVQRINLSYEFSTAGEDGGVLPAVLADFPKLQTLWVAGGKYSDFSVLAKLANLTTLDISDNAITSALAVLADVQTLEKLYLRDCGITDFPKEVSALPALTYLNLDRNKISVLPDEMPVTLRWIRLNANELSSIPDGVGKMVFLQRIYLRNNRLTSLPHGLAGCTLLEDIDLAQNHFEEFPKVLAKLPKLRNVDLTGNRKIVALPPDDVLKEMKALRTLRLVGCPIPTEERERIRAALDSACVILF